MGAGIHSRVGIPLSKRKLYLYIAVSMALVAGAADIVFNYNVTWQSSPLLVAACVVGIILFGGIAFFLLTRIFSPRPGLIIDELGITDNTSAAGVGLIKWSDITDVSMHEDGQVRRLLLFTAVPQKYLQTGSWLRRKMLSGAMATYGTPLFINVMMLQCDPAVLESMIWERLAYWDADKDNDVN